MIKEVLDIEEFIQILKSQKEYVESKGGESYCQSIANRTIELNITDCMLEELIATNSIFAGTLTGLKFIECELENSLFKECKLTSIIFRESNLALATFDKCILSNIETTTNLFTSTKFINSEIYNCKNFYGLEDTKFINCTLCNVNFEGPLKSVNFSGSKLVNCNFRNCQINQDEASKINFKGATLVGCYFDKDIVNQLDFSHSNIKESNIKLATGADILEKFLTGDVSIKELTIAIKENRLDRDKVLLAFENKLPEHTKKHKLFI